MLNVDSISKLISINKDDAEMLNFINSCITSFENYHKAVFVEQMFLKIYGSGALDADEYRERRTAADKKRTMYHNSVISNVNILNRLALKSNVEPVYEGIVSEEKPYRREVANSVFEYIEYIINNRS